MSVTVASIYTDVAHLLMEGTSLSLVYSEANFLDDLLTSTRTLLQETGLVQGVFTISGTAGVGKYTLSDAIGDVIAVFWNNNYLYPSTAAAMQVSNTRWETAARPPEQWSMDLLVPDTIQISPLPAVNGTLTIIGTIQPTAGALLAGDNIPLVPDSLCHYLTFGALEKIWQSDGEARDLNRAKYCRARLEEARNVARSVVEEGFAEVL